jgi:hypothetical protein
MKEKAAKLEQDRINRESRMKEQRERDEMEARLRE